MISKTIVNNLVELIILSIATYLIWNPVNTTYLTPILRMVIIITLFLTLLVYVFAKNHARSPKKFLSHELRELKNELTFVSLSTTYRLLVVFVLVGIIETIFLTVQSATAYSTDTFSGFGYPFVFYTLQYKDKFSLIYFLANISILGGSVYTLLWLGTKLRKIL